MILSPSLIRSLQRPIAGAMRAVAQPGTKHEARRSMLVMALARHKCQRFYSSSAKTGVTLPEQAPKESPVIAPEVRRPRSSPAHTRWSQELDDKIRELRHANRTWEYISLVTERSTSACSDRYYTALDPALRTWTPAMFEKLKHMVDDGVGWAEIGATLGHKIIACQHQWRTLGRGHYRLKGFMSGAHNLKWSQLEIILFWSAWLEHGIMDWNAISASVGSRSAKDCKDAFRALAVSAAKDAPGWAKIEIYNYVTDVSKMARSRTRLEMDRNPVAAEQDPLQWTQAEHDALLKAVEKYGLFSGWDNIRSLVKPELKDDQVEAEYYRLNGVAMKSDIKRPTDAVVKAQHQDASWTENEIELLNTILMKYSSLQPWKEEAAKRGIIRLDSDYELVFRKAKGLKVQDAQDATSSQDHSELSGRNWDSDQIQRLRRLVGQQQQQERASGYPINWPWIAEHIGPGIDASMCITKWHSLPEHQSSLKIEPARFWVEDDIKALKEGIVKYGKSWRMIQRHYFPERTTDSIRRKISNLKKNRDELVQSQREIATEKRLTNKDLNVDAYVEQALHKEPSYKLMKELEVLFEEVARKPKASAKAQAKTAASLDA